VVVFNQAVTRPNRPYGGRSYCRGIRNQPAYEECCPEPHLVGTDGRNHPPDAGRFDRWGDQCRVRPCWTANRPDQAGRRADQLGPRNSGATPVYLAPLSARASWRGARSGLWDRPRLNRAAADSGSNAGVVQSLVPPSDGVGMRPWSRTTVLSTRSISRSSRRYPARSTSRVRRCNRCRRVRQFRHARSPVPAGAQRCGRRKSSRHSWAHRVDTSEIQHCCSRRGAGHRGRSICATNRHPARHCRHLLPDAALL
jgi:hypothetical protein